MRGRNRCENGRGFTDIAIQNIGFRNGRILDKIN